MRHVKDILIERDDLTEQEAEELMRECREELYDGNLDAIQEILGLEPDYIFDLI